MSFIEDSIADSKETEQVLRGIQPKNQFMFRIFKLCKWFFLGFVGFALLMFGLTFVRQFQFISSSSLYQKAFIYIGFFGLCFLVLALLIKLIFLRKAPFDDWIFEIAEKRLGTSVIFYTSKYIYIEYDRAGKEVDKKEFVTEMSDKSVNYSYFYIKTFIDSGVIQVECKKRQPIPNSAMFKEEDDLYWNVIPLGLTINNITQSISPVGWYLNDQNVNSMLLDTIPSTSILIAGGTGCESENSPIMIYNHMLTKERISE